MAYVRWLYKSWNFFWTFVGVIVLTVTIMAGAIFGVMQLQPVKNYVAEQLEDQFNRKFEGILSIGQLSGLLPLTVEMKEVKIYPDKNTYTPVFDSESIVANIDVWSLLKNQLLVNSAELQSPSLIFDRDSSFSLEKAFTLLPQADSTSSETSQIVDASNRLGFKIVVPSVMVYDGKTVIRNYRDRDSLSINNVDLQVFVEITDEQRFLDIDNLSFDLPKLDITGFRAYGQIYNDERFFEVNALNVIHGNSAIRFNGEVDGLNFLKGNIRQQLDDASFSYLIDRISFTPELLATFIPRSTDYIQSNMMGSVEGEGTLDSLSISASELILGDSFIRFDGGLGHYLKPQEITYNLNIPQLSIAQQELKSFRPFLNDSLQTALAQTSLQAQIEGNTQNTEISMSADHYKRGNIELEGTMTWGQEVGIDARFRTTALDIGSLVNPKIGTSDLGLRGQFKTNSLDIMESEGGLTIESGNGSLDDRTFNQLSVLANWTDGYIEPDVRINIDEALFSTTGYVDLSSEIPSYSLRGSASNLKVKEIFRWQELKPVTADLEFDVTLFGKKPTDMYGRLSLDVLQAAFAEDTLGRHQLYMDFNTPEAAEREIRFTSTAFDANVKGSFTPDVLLDLSREWKTYFMERYKDEIALDTSFVVKPDTVNLIPSQDFTMSLNFKNLAIVNAYLPKFPKLASTGRLNSTVNVNSRRMLFNASFMDSKTSIESFEADSLNIQATGSFRINRKLKDFSGLQVQMDAGHLIYNAFNGRDFQLSANLDENALDLDIRADRLADEANFMVNMDGVLEEDQLHFKIADFNLSSDTYQWRSLGEPTVRYYDREKLTFEEFQFESDSQFVQVNGTFSSSPEDSVNYEIGNLDLGKISQILDIRLDFAGKLNGKFTTTTLTSIPTIDGNIEIEGLYLGNNLYGDLNINSTYNPDFKRFDTQIISTTDSTKYPEYYANNGRKGQFFQIDGYVLAPQGGSFPSADSIFAFNADFENIDLWVLPLIGPKVFAEGAGLATATGKIWGNLDTFDYQVDISVGTEDAAFIRPRFLDTDYYAQGDITWNRSRGFIFRDIYLIDPSGGNAILSGFYDVNDFAPVDTMDINLDMDEFQFLNSAFDPTVAFFGEAFGSGRVTISGTNLDPVLATEGPVMITDFSEISIPLLEETEFDEDHRFIRFVSSFDDQAVSQSKSRFQNNNTASQTLTAEEEEELTFAERFTLDLQFEAQNPMNVRLIFDPVTGDIITAQGTGRIRILLEDEQVSMFGRFDISGGRYQFVSGDIFTRRFEIEPGGTIIWEGDPANASLNVNAIYSARPDINTLSGTGRRDPENAQRVPVELVLNIGGTITSIENNFFFRLPDTFEAQQNSTLSTQLASINRDENLKLIQATNFMLMGDFIPVSSAGDPQANLFAENISGSAAVLNPLLSSQVINPLLSNQVNSLLNSDLSSLDVDFNLNTYNQVDLGVALRLYNDKLILRREGQITGRQSSIGDLGATYRINRTFAVTAFHRQDLTFGTLGSTEQSQQSQEINGVGLEAKVSFNTWDEFFKRLFSPFRKLFGTKEEQDQEEITENRQDQNPV